MKFKDIFNDDLTPNWELIETIPEFNVLSVTEQSSVWHQEGDALTHTKMVAKEMWDYLNSTYVESSESYKLMMMAAAVCHDLGKGCTTSFNKEKNDWECKRHGFESARITRTLFFDEDLELREAVCYICRWHMTLHHIFDKPERTNKALMRLSLGPVTVRDMNVFQMCDSYGSINEETREYIYEKTMKIKDAAETLHCYMGSCDAFHNTWHRIKFFLGRDYVNPNEIEVPAESYNPEFEVVVMVGVPGAGKDWYCEHNLPDYKMLSRDIIRSEIGLKGEKPQGNKEQEKEVTRIFDERMKQYCESKTSFVINNTNVRRQYRDGYLEKILPYYPRVKYVYCEAPSLEVNKERRRNMMPEKVIDRMWKDFDYPEGIEYYSMEINKQTK